MVPIAETCERYYTWDPRPETQDFEKGTWDPYDKRELRPKTNIPCQTWAARTMIQNFSLLIT